MSLLRPELPDPNSRAGLALVLEAASLAATGCLVWQASTPVAWPGASWTRLVVLSLAYPLFAWFASAAITLGLCFLFLEWDHEELLQATVRTSAAAVWFAPALVLASGISPGALAAIDHFVLVPRGM